MINPILYICRTGKEEKKKREKRKSSDVTPRARKAFQKERKREGTIA